MIRQATIPIILLLVLTACVPTWQEIRALEPVRQGMSKGHYKTLAICFIRASEAEDSWGGRLDYKILDNEQARQAYVSVLFIPGGIWAISPAQPIMEWMFTQTDPENTLVAVRARNPIDGQERWESIERCTRQGGSG